ncbi:hypothetical protein Ndes2526A_g09121 [Nannochloris sp. 'desiccata']
MDPAILASPYESGLYFVSPEPGTTLQSIGTTEWKVGQRYKLQKVLGYGSFSCVCLAIDTITGERVALKRIGDVLHSAEGGKRVLREISILRRTAHPNLIGLRDCFLRPSTTGQCRMVDGRLVNCSIDLYIAMEFADGGDFFHMRGQLAPAEVTSVLWQLLQAVQYMHSLHIWHRDIKSQNAFIHWENGVRVVKLGDFGSARSALLYELERENNPVFRRDIYGNGGVASAFRGNNTKPNNDQQQQQEGQDNKNKEQQRLRPAPLSAAERSFKQMDEAMQTEDLYADLGERSTDMDSIGIVPAASDEDLSTWNNDNSVGQSQQKLEKERQQFLQRQQQNQNQGLVMTMSHSKSSHGRGFKAPLTRVVATPCYRAPEVVMSRGGYSSALDMWGIGCIFGELLQRVAYIGSASNPNLAVAPLFALHCFPKTPETGETFGRPECAGTRRELQALFDVVGTPSWRDAAAVEMQEWRRYLERLPGKAPTLYRRFKPAGEVAIHLLTRLLDFDPNGRAACEEALAHEFFAAIRKELNISSDGGITIAADFNNVPAADGNSNATMRENTVSVAREGCAVTVGGEDAEMEDKEDNDRDGDVVIKENENISVSASVAVASTTGSDILSANMRVLSFDGPGLGETLSVDAAAAAATLEALHSTDPVLTNTIAIGGAGNTIHGSVQTLPCSNLLFKSTGTDGVEKMLLPSRGGGGGGGEGAAIPTTTAAAVAAAIAVEEVNPGKALALLEEELETISESAPDGLLDPTSEGCQRLRQLLEAEVEAAAAEAAARTALRTAATANINVLKQGYTEINTAGKAAAARGGGGGGGAPAKIDQAAFGPRGASLDYGRERLNNVADTVQGRELDPNKFLGSKRHGEWTAQGGDGRVAPGPRWGVTAVPPGLNSEDPRVKEIIQKQQGR